MHSSHRTKSAEHSIDSRQSPVHTSPIADALQSVFSCSFHVSQAPQPLEHIDKRTATKDSSLGGADFMNFSSSSAVILPRRRLFAIARPQSLQGFREPGIVIHFCNSVIPSSKNCCNLYAICPSSWTTPRKDQKRSSSLKGDDLTNSSNSSGVIFPSCCRSAMERSHSSKG